MESKIIGKPTLLVEKSGKEFFVHSKYNPEREGKAFAEKYYSGPGTYFIFGLGLGYHIEELARVLDRNKAEYIIYVIETNIEVYRLFKKVNSKLLDNERVRIVKIFDGDNIKDINYSEDRLYNCIHEASIELVPNQFESIKDFMVECLVIENLSKEKIKRLKDNFNSNIGLYDRYVNDLFGKFKGKTMYLISAGPSLDKNVRHLKKVKEDRIISVGRAVRTLVDEGIVPDYIVVTDPSEKLYENQLNGLNLKVPLIVLSTCDMNFMKEYKGIKYIAFQSGFEEAEKYAFNRGLSLVETGGSVATTALDIGIKMGFRRIVFVGQDLAFTDNKTHSEASNGGSIKKQSNFIEIEDIYGEKILTRKNLNIYRRWIERRIKREDNIVFIDATEGGAKIKGSKIMRLEEAIEN